MTYTESLTRAALRLYGDNERTRMAIEMTLAEARRCEICGRRALATGTDPRCAEHDKEMRG